MRILRTLMLCAVVFGSAAGSMSAGQQPAAPPSKPGFTLTTSGFDDGGIIPAKYTMLADKPVSPPLSWTNVPENTVSFVLIVHDMNVSIQKGAENALHWAAFNIPASATGMPEGVPGIPQLPDGTIELKVIRGKVGFFPPGAPAIGPYHHYSFDVYALDTKLDLTPDATRADVLKAIDGHILGKAVLAGRFHR